MKNYLKKFHFKKVVNFFFICILPLKTTSLAYQKLLDSTVHESPLHTHTLLRGCKA